MGSIFIRNSLHTKHAYGHVYPWEVFLKTDSGDIRQPYLLKGNQPAETTWQNIRLFQHVVCRFSFQRQANFLLS